MGCRIHRSFIGVNSLVSGTTGPSGRGPLMSGGNCCSKCAGRPVRCWRPAQRLRSWAMKPRQSGARPVSASWLPDAVFGVGYDPLRVDGTSAVRHSSRSTPADPRFTS